MREHAEAPPTKGQGMTLRQQHRASACLAFSPDGTLLASGPAWEGDHYLLTNWPEITLWDVATAREVLRFAGHPYQICSLAFSADGERLASSGGEPEARVWDVATGREVDHRTGHPHGIMELAVSPADGTVFTIGNDDGLVIHWDPADGHALETLAVAPDRFDGLAVFPDGGILLIGCTDGFILWDLVTHKELRRIKTEGVRLAFSPRPVFSPDGRTFASGLWVWDVISGRRLDAFRKKLAPPRAGTRPTAAGCSLSRRMGSASGISSRVSRLAVRFRSGSTAGSTQPSRRTVGLWPPGMSTGSLRVLKGQDSIRPSGSGSLPRANRLPG